MTKFTPKLSNLNSGVSRLPNTSSGGGTSGGTGAAPKGQFVWRPLNGPLVIKLGEDDKNGQDLESAPVSRALPFFLATTLARVGSGGVAELTEAYCTSSIRSRISNGGGNALDMATYFFENRWPKTVRTFANTSFWANQIRNDRAFKAMVQELTQSIQDTMQRMADDGLASPTVMDVNQLADGDSQPQPLRRFATNLGFSAKSDPSRLASDPLAYGIGDIQGIKISITSFSGQPDGAFSYKMSFQIWDHFGSNDGDLYDPAQACLWLLQRKMIAGQDKTRFNPYIVEILVDDVPGSGKVVFLPIMGGRP